MTELSVIDLGRLGGTFRHDPHPVYARLRAAGPVHRVRMPGAAPGQTAWLIVGYEEARAALADPRLAKDGNKIGVTFLEEQYVGKHLLASDPPQHTRLRSLVTRAFTGRRVERLHSRIQAIVDDLLDDMLPRGHADLIDAFAGPLPMTVICELLGVPHANRAELRDLTVALVAPVSRETQTEAGILFADHITRLIANKRRAGPSDDLLSDLIRTAAEDGDRLSTPELRAMAYILLIGGFESTVNLIGNGVLALLTHPEQLYALRADMSLLDGAVEEMLRYEGPVECATFRYAAEALEIGGAPIAPGQQVVIGLTAAQHDDARFPQPHTFDIYRDTRGHLAFGHGLHHCLGAPLARLEGRIAIGTLLARAPGLKLRSPAEEWLPGMLVRGVRSLPVCW